MNNYLEYISLVLMHISHANHAPDQVPNLTPDPVSDSVPNPAPNRAPNLAPTEQRDNLSNDRIFD